MVFLSAYQRKKLKEHKYRSEGVSLFEQLFLKRFWRWLVTKFPMWVAPNTITLTGFVIMLFTTLCVLLQDLNCEGKAPRWSYLLCAVGIFLYQTLDGIDGPQARRTGTSSPLGEYFDHGLDAITTFIYAATAACIPGLQEYPFFLLMLMAVMIHINYVYHWQTYVSGVLYFKFVDVSEAHYAQIVALLLTFFLGEEIWHHQTLAFLGIYYPLKYMFVLGTLFFSVVNILSAYHIVLTRGVGKNGSTLADTSVLSPIISPLISLSVSLLYAVRSPEQLLQNHCLLFLTVFYLPMTKSVVWMMIAAMTKSPYPLLDSIMLGPLLAYANIYFGSPLPELYIALGIAGFNIVNITWTWIGLCWEISETLGVPCFTITSSPSSSSSSSVATPTTKHIKLNGSSNNEINNSNNNGNQLKTNSGKTGDNATKTTSSKK